MRLQDRLHLGMLVKAWGSTAGRDQSGRMKHLAATRCLWSEHLPKEPKRAVRK